MKWLVMSATIFSTSSYAEIQVPLYQDYVVKSLVKTQLYVINATNIAVNFSVGEVGQGEVDYSLNSAQSQLIACVKCKEFTARISSNGVVSEYLLKGARRYVIYVDAGKLAITDFQSYQQYSLSKK